MSAWRPYNETTADLDREAAALRTICEWGRCKAIKLSPKIYSVDWAFSRDGELIGFGEYKERSRRYRTLLIGLGKWIKGRQLSRDTGLPFFLFVGWPDGIFYFKTADEGFRIEMGGNDRGQNGDIEPVVHIPTDRFRCILPR